VPEAVPEDEGVKVVRSSHYRKYCISLA